MSALAKLCKALGFEVSGSDDKDSEVLQNLCNLGILVYVHNKEGVWKNTENSRNYTRNSVINTEKCPAKNAENLCKNSENCEENTKSKEYDASNQNNFNSESYKQNKYVSREDDRENIKNCDTFIYTTAVGENNNVVRSAREMGKRVLERAEFLGEIAGHFKHTIAVSGTHGKTTSTALLGGIFKKADKKLTVHVGGDVAEFKGNLLLGGRDYFITEACEFNRSFLHIIPECALITNIECDHMDTYKNLDEIKEAFKQFAEQATKFVVYNGDLIDGADLGYYALTKSGYYAHEKYEKIDKNTQKINNFLKNDEQIKSEILKKKKQANDDEPKQNRQTKGADCKKTEHKTFVSFGFSKDNDCYAKNLRESAGKFSFDCYYMGQKLGRVKMNIAGKHNVYNALGCIAVAVLYGVDFCDIVAEISKFSGVNRRLTLLKRTKNADHYQDYAHHPTEIKATLETLRLLKYNKIIALFQPHTYSRTLALMPEFIGAFDSADFLFILPTYPAREEYQFGGDAVDLFYNINGRKKCMYCSNFYTMKYELDKMLCDFSCNISSKNKKAPRTCVVWLGAGDIDECAQRYTQGDSSKF